MKNNQMKKLGVVALSLVSSMAIAQDYPASSFEPKVVYSNPDHKESAASASTAKVAPPVSKAAEVENDPNYPAANYQPKVLFNDTSYKHGQSAPSVVSSSKSTVVVESADDESAASAPAKSDSSNNLIGLVAVAAIGFFLYSKKGGQNSSATSNDYSDAVGGATGVEKYIDRLGMNKTGVARYLEKQGSNQTTGVARYMAKQIVKDREVAAAKVTGVEKYLKDKG